MITIIISKWCNYAYQLWKENGNRFYQSI